MELSEMKWVAGIVNSVAVLALLICVSIFLPTFHKGFYSMEYDKHGIPDGIGVPKEELMSVTDKLLGYMKGEQDDLVVSAHVHGEYREFFNDREKSHMIDVKDLFTIGFQIRNIALLVFALTILLPLFFKINPGPVFARTCQVFLSGFLLISTALVIVVALDFDKAFTIFHELFFTNDLWILNPETDLLVNIVPTGFFVDIAALAAGLLILLTITVITGCSLYLRRMAPRAKESSGGNP